MKSGTIFDNFLITDDVEEAEKFGTETWGATKVKSYRYLWAIILLISTAMCYSALNSDEVRLTGVVYISGARKENEGPTGRGRT